jgi:uncharacterized tellurite resistance protein B-like protein
MLDSLRRFFSDMGAESSDKVALGEDEVRLAAAALLFHVIAIDGVIGDEEKALLGDLLKRRLRRARKRRQSTSTGSPAC